MERLIGAAVSVPLLMNTAAGSLSRRKEMADLLVGVAGDFVPPREVLNVSFVTRLVVDALLGMAPLERHRSVTAANAGRVPASPAI